MNQLASPTINIATPEIADWQAFSKNLQANSTLRSPLCVLLCPPGEMFFNDNVCKPVRLGFREFVEYSRSLVACEIGAKLEARTSNDALYQQGTQLLLAVNNIALGNFESSVDLCSSVMQDIGTVASCVTEDTDNHLSNSLIRTVGSLVRAFNLQSDLQQDSVNQIPWFSLQFVLDHGDSSSISISRLESLLQQTIKGYDLTSNAEFIIQSSDVASTGNAQSLATLLQGTRTICTTQ